VTVDREIRGTGYSCLMRDVRTQIKKINLISAVMVKVDLIGCWQYLSYPRSPSLITINFQVRAGVANSVPPQPPDIAPYDVD